MVDLNQIIKDAQSDIDALPPSLRSLFNALINKVEELSLEVQALKAENQKLRDENNRLKGEQGKPGIRPQTRGGDFSSEKERKTHKDGVRKSKAKNYKIKVNRTERRTVDKTKLPKDAVFKGYAYSIVQDLSIKADNVEFEREVYYSSSNKKTYTADLPQGYEGEFGPGIKAYILNAHYNSRMSHAAIVESLKAYCIEISACTVSRILTDKKEDFHKEKQDIVEAGLSLCVPQQADDTSARIKGQNAFVHILCNPFFTAFFSRPDKTRLTVLEVLSGHELRFSFDDKAYALMREFELPEKGLQSLKEQNPGMDLSRKQVDELLARMYPNPRKHTTNRKIILEASAISAYQATPNAIKILLTDDAPQFKELTELLGLCWVHEGRHYKKLTPYVLLNREKVGKFVEEFWKYYRKLLAYKELPELERAKRKVDLSQEFDRLFSIKTGYTLLDERIRLTKAKRENLLLVLDHPEVPLHNNAAELAARIQARRRDMSFHTMSEKGTRAKDTFMTLIATAKKHSVNVYDYLCDRITKQYKMPSIASLITKASYQHLDIPPPLLP